MQAHSYTPQYLPHFWLWKILCVLRDAPHRGAERNPLRSANDSLGFDAGAGAAAAAATVAAPCSSDAAGVTAAGAGAGVASAGSSMPRRSANALTFGLVEATSCFSTATKPLRSSKELVLLGICSAAGRRGQMQSAATVPQRGWLQCMRLVATNLAVF